MVWGEGNGDEEKVLLPLLWESFYDVLRLGTQPREGTHLQTEGARERDAGRGKWRIEKIDSTQSLKEGEYARKKQTHRRIHTGIPWTARRGGMGGCVPVLPSHTVLWHQLLEDRDHLCSPPFLRRKIKSKLEIWTKIIPWEGESVRRIEWWHHLSRLLEIEPTPIECFQRKPVNIWGIHYKNTQFLRMYIICTHNMYRKPFTQFCAYINLPASRYFIYTLSGGTIDLPTQSDTNIYSTTAFVGNIYTCTSPLWTGQRSMTDHSMGPESWPTLLRWR